MTGDVLPDGSEGELVFTSLTKEAMPIIRYRTRDLTRLLPGTTRTMRRMDRITGRSDDMMIVRGVNVFPGQIEEQILGCAALTPHYQIELTRPNRMDQVRVLVEPRSDAGADEQAQDAKKLAARIKTLIGISVTVDVRPEGSLPRSQGKAARVLDHRIPA